MYGFRAAFLLSITLIGCLVGYLFYQNEYERFVIFPITNGEKESVYIFDKKNHSLQVCQAGKKCQFIPFILESKHNRSTINFTYKGEDNAVVIEAPQQQEHAPKIKNNAEVEKTSQKFKSRKNKDVIDDAKDDGSNADLLSDDSNE